MLNLRNLVSFHALCFLIVAFVVFLRIPVLLWNGLKLQKRNVPEEQIVQVVMKQNGTWSLQSLLRRNLIQMEVLKIVETFFSLYDVLIFFYDGYL